MKPGKAAVKAEKKEMKASVKAMTPPAKSKPGVSPNPLVTGGKAMPKLSGPLGGMPKAGMGGLLGGMAPKPRTAGTPKPPVRSTAKPAMVQPSRGGLSSVVSKANLPTPSGAKRVMAEPKQPNIRSAPKPLVQPKPVIRSTAKPAMPGRKK
jgi:hypothetical protein